MSISQGESLKKRDMQMKRKTCYLKYFIKILRFQEELKMTSGLSMPNNYKEETLSNVSEVSLKEKKQKQTNKQRKT